MISRCHEEQIGRLPMVPMGLGAATAALFAHYLCRFLNVPWKLDSEATWRPLSTACNSDHSAG